MATNTFPVLGSMVRYNTGKEEGHFEGFYGRVIAIERYTDELATKTWLYVRWISPEGKPDSEPMKHSAHELVEMDPIT